MYELLFWFELELTDHKIAKRIDANYRKAHRFYNKVRERLFEYEENSIELLDGEVEVDETYFGADFKNRRRSKREKLRKEGRVKRGRGAKGLKEAVFGIYEREDGIVYIKPVADRTLYRILSKTKSTRCLWLRYLLGEGLSNIRILN